MPALSVTEKEHWKDRISRRIDKRIEAIAAEEPNLMDRIKRQARERALQSLGLVDLQRELENTERQVEELRKRDELLQRAMLAHVRGVPPDQIDTVYSAYQLREVETAIERRQVVHEEELLAEGERGQRIIRLRREKDNLVDVVWLATSGKQIKDLWTRVGALLGDTPTPLEQEALAIEPVSDG